MKCPNTYFLGKCSVVSQLGKNIICFHSSQISITLCDRQLPMISKDIDTRLTTIFLPNMAHSLENFRKISEFLIFFLINQQVYSISLVSFGYKSRWARRQNIVKRISDSLANGMSTTFESLVFLSAFWRLLRPKTGQKCWKMESAS